MYTATSFFPYIECPLTNKAAKVRS